MREFLENVPKAELHLHLRGAAPAGFLDSLLAKYAPSQILENAPVRHVELFRSCRHLAPFLETQRFRRNQAAGLFGYQSFQEFLITFLFTSYLFREIGDFRALIQAVRRELSSQKIVYAEITVSVVEYVNQGLALDDILDVLDETAAAPGVRIRWIVDLVRNIGPEPALNLLRDILDRKPAHVAGITLGGSEDQFPPALFAQTYRLARDHGLRLTVHAGEALGPESVWDALRVLGAERIGHGVRSIEDQRLVAHLAEHAIPLEICPTSNLRTGLYSSYGEHPVRALYEAGVPISINTDDPSFFGTTLVSEYEHLLRNGFLEEDILVLLRNGFRHAFLPRNEKQGWLDQLDRSREA